ncbi:MAG: hypothetical protein A2Y62_00790 [Candidatus Fischerbacteria bacterium RBG_13_37_8]|uniref:Metal-dependent hydrolase n=1 Tax=Candidatus Fischerbacteria bacterium RBG_13_37_8 TaxID=1817863 RepID=A0A1F5VMU5_9BACT|nr:MAG: hypothetical protein A2Y62_00790 [Candidatus Fischerbacteria bacterium RBG_13_37_8]
MTHTIIAGSGGLLFQKKREPVKFWIITVLCSVIADADVVGFRLGIEYNSFWGHRGFFHSLFFALLFAFICALLFFREHVLFSRKWWRYMLFFSILGASHSITDAFTSGGYGIALLSPFDTTRYFFPFTPIEVAPISIRKFLSCQGIRVMASEIICIWLPIFIFGFWPRIAKKARIA